MNWSGKQTKERMYQQVIAENKVAIFRNDTRKYHSIWPKQ